MFDSHAIPFYLAGNFLKVTSINCYRRHLQCHAATDVLLKVGIISTERWVSIHDDPQYKSSLMAIILPLNGLIFQYIK